MGRSGNASDGDSDDGMQQSRALSQQRRLCDDAMALVNAGVALQNATPSDAAAAEAKLTQAVKLMEQALAIEYPTPEEREASVRLNNKMNRYVNMIRSQLERAAGGGGTAGGNANRFHAKFNIIDIEKLPEIYNPVQELLRNSSVAGDIFESLKLTFGFQEDNVQNQKEHLLLLLTNFKEQSEEESTDDAQGKRDPQKELELAKQEIRNYDDFNEFFWTKKCLKYNAANIAEAFAEVDKKAVTGFALNMVMFCPDTPILYGVDVSNGPSRGFTVFGKNFTADDLQGFNPYEYDDETANGLNDADANDETLGTASNGKCLIPMLASCLGVTYTGEEFKSIPIDFKALLTVVPFTHCIQQNSGRLVTDLMKALLEVPRNTKETDVKFQRALYRVIECMETVLNAMKKIFGKQENLVQILNDTPLKQRSFFFPGDAQPYANTQLHKLTRFFFLAYGIYLQLAYNAYFKRLNLAINKDDPMTFILSGAMFALVLLMLCLGYMGSRIKKKMTFKQKRLRKMKFALSCFVLVLFLASFMLFSFGNLFEIVMIMGVATYWFLQVCVYRLQSSHIVVRTIARGFDRMIGWFIFGPILFVAMFLPFISSFQQRVMFNNAFTAGLEVSKLFANEAASTSAKVVVKKVVKKKKRDD
ncbi:hypothetical protein P43SY_009217 [Pythium insidiosum]|uniref:Callose synthase n=1 Tax=Pythium insidiosum TaxID=114742 RepID=A0AAD5LLL8_PYTIN|nr:hypothetical protein P43SY_009217 [Pythium insidiosum]